MNAIDTLVLVLVAFNLILGAVRGAAWQILRIATIVLGVWTSREYGRDFFEMFPAGWGLDAEPGLVIAHVVVFVIVYLVMFGFTQLVRSLIQKVKLGSTDRTIGAALGAAKGAFFASMLLYLQFVPFVGDIETVRDHLYGNPEKQVEASHANDYFLTYLKDRIDEMVPDDAEQRVNDIRDRVGEKLTERQLEKR